MKSYISVLLLCLLTGLVRGFQFDLIQMKVYLVTKCGYSAAFGYSICGDEMHAAGNFRRALNCYDKAVKLKVGQKAYECYLVGRGNMYEEVGQYQEAEQDYIASIKVNPNYWISSFCLGELRKRLDKQDLAAEDLKRSYRIALLHDQKGSAYILSKYPEVRQGKQ